MFCMGTISLYAYQYVIYMSIYYILIYTVLYCTLLRNDYMYLYLLYILLVYIHSLSFFLLACSYTLVNALYRHVLVVCMCCVCIKLSCICSHVLYFYVYLCLLFAPFVRLRPLRSFRSLEGLYVPLPPCLRSRPLLALCVRRRVRRRLACHAFVVR